MPVRVLPIYIIQDLRCKLYLVKVKQSSSSPISTTFWFKIKPQTNQIHIKGRVAVVWIRKYKIDCCHVKTLSWFCIIFDVCSANLNYKNESKKYLSNISTFHQSVRHFNCYTKAKCHLNWLHVMCFNIEPKVRKNSPTHHNID